MRENLAFDPVTREVTRDYGASAAAMHELGRRKGYSLVAVTGFENLFFVASELLSPADRCCGIEELFEFPMDFPCWIEKLGYKPSWLGKPDPDPGKWVDV